MRRVVRDTPKSVPAAAEVGRYVRRRTQLSTRAPRSAGTWKASSMDDLPRDARFSTPPRNRPSGRHRAPEEAVPGPLTGAAHVPQGAAVPRGARSSSHSAGVTALLATATGEV